MFNIKIRVTIGDSRYEEIIKTLDDPPTNELYDNLQHENAEGEIELLLPFIPQVGMHIGDCQLLTVCQVYWRGGKSFDVDTRHIQCVDYNVRIAVAQQQGSFEMYPKDEWDPVTRNFANVQEAMDRVQSLIPWSNGDAAAELVLSLGKWRWKQTKWQGDMEEDE